MKKISLIILLIFSSCTMWIPPNVREKQVVEQYLDSINKPNKTKLIELIKIESIDNYYINKKNQNILINDSTYDSYSDSEKAFYKKIIDTAEKLEKPNGYFCSYWLDTLEHRALIKLNGTRSKVVHFTEVDY